MAMKGNVHISIWASFFEREKEKGCPYTYMKVVFVCLTLRFSIIFISLFRKALWTF